MTDATFAIEGIDVQTFKKRDIPAHCPFDGHPVRYHVTMHVYPRGAALRIEWFDETIAALVREPITAEAFAAGLKARTIAVLAAATGFESANHVHVRVRHVDETDVTLTVDA